MNWYMQFRQEWIGEALRVYGFINRKHIRRKFGVSEAQAAVDLREFRRGNPGACEYDKQAKHYYATPATRTDAQAGRQER